MRFLVLAAVCLQVVFGLAPLFTQRETIEKNGVRSYIVVLNEHAPLMSVLEKVQDWLKSEIPSVDPTAVQFAYSMGTEFNGFAAYLTPDCLNDVLAHGSVRYVEEDQVMRIAQTNSTTRQDWGQVRINQRKSNLATVPAGIYTAASSTPSVGSQTTWNWASGVSGSFQSAARNAFINILDTGVRPTHQEFRTSATDATTRVIRSVSYISGENATYDGNGHGTHCAGSAAGLWKGTATGASIISIKVLSASGSGSTAGVVAGINDAGNNLYSGYNFMSMSLGGGGSTAIDDAVNAAAVKGQVPVVAAGNDNTNACTNTSPARAARALAIGAIQSTDAKASFSSYGTCLAAQSPGVNIYSATNTGDTNYATLSGTSMATPLACGALAVWASANGGTFTETQARAALNSYASEPGATGFPAGTTNRIVTTARAT